MFDNVIVDTSTNQLNEFRVSCVTCKNSDTEPPEDAEWWLKCKIGKQPVNNDVGNACENWEKHPIFNLSM